METKEILRDNLMMMVSGLMAVILVLLLYFVSIWNEDFIFIQDIKWAYIMVILIWIVVLLSTISFRLEILNKTSQEKY